MKTNPLRRVVNQRIDIKTGGASRLREELTGEFRMLCKWCPAYSGREFIPGFHWELREPVITMFKEEIQITKFMSMRVPMRDTGTELLVVVRKHL